MQAQPIHFHPPADDVAGIRLPEAGSLFGERAARFAVLAAGHSLADWLAFLGRLSQAQQYVMTDRLTVSRPDAGQLVRAREHGMPPLDPSQPPAGWQDAVRDLAAYLLAQSPEACPATLPATLRTVREASDADMARWAGTLFDGKAGPSDVAVLSMVAAGLQVVYTSLASQLDVTALHTFDQHNVCPCCGSPAVASVVRLGNTVNNLRYLHCSLCNTEWNVPRAVCCECGDDRAVAVQELDSAADVPGAAIRAETCDSCGSYLKIVYQDKDPQVDPVADDLASLALDVLLDEAGYQRAGPNLLLLGAHADA